MPASHNQSLEFAIKCVEIAQQFCPAVSIIWVAPEDLGGHVQTGPPSVWQFRETTQLQSRTSEVVRGVAYSCELGAADYTRPIGFSRTFQDLFASCVKDGPCSIIEDLFYVTEVLCLSRVLAVPNILPSRE